MSPEQAQALETVDHRTDVFSLGAVLFEAIAGQPYMPERPTYEQTILQLVSTTAPLLSTVVPDIPPALDRLVADMLEHDVTRRTPNMRAVRERLEGVYPELAGSTVKLKSLPPGSSPSLERYVVHGSAAPLGPTVSGTSAAIALPKTRRPLLYVAALAVALGALVGIAAMWSSRGTDRVAAPVATIAPAAPPPVLAVIPPPPPEAAPTPAAPTSATASAPSALPPSSGSAPAVKTGHARPRDQVGAAGISSQF
jgi:serine/threonine protein kinase